MYEAMLLVEPTIASREWNRVTEEVDRILKRNGATVLSVAKWGERKLAFPVKKSNRGTYVLVYFNAPPDAPGKIRGDLTLSEIVLRYLVLKYEGEMRKDIPKDFETAGTVPYRRAPIEGDLGDAGFGGRGPRF